MTAGPRRGIYYWHKVCKTKSAQLDPVFSLSPKEFLQQCAQPGFLERYKVKQCIKVIKNSAWSNELALIYISMVLEKKVYDRSHADPLLFLTYCKDFLEQCSESAGGKRKVQHDYHMKYDYWHLNGQVPSEHFYEHLYPAFKCALVLVERLLPTLSTHEQRALARYQLDIHSQELSDRPASTTLDALRTLLPEDMQRLRGTALEPGWSGSGPERRVLGFLCTHLDLEFFPWLPELAAYALICSAQGASQEVLLKHLTEGGRYLSAWTTWLDHGFRWPKPQPPELMTHIVRTLAQHPELYSYADNLSNAMQLNLWNQIEAEAQGWAGVLGDTPAEQALLQLIDSHPALQTLDEFQLLATSYLSKWRACPYFLHLVLLTVGFAANRDSVPDTFRRFRLGRHQQVDQVTQA